MHSTFYAFESGDEVFLRRPGNLGAKVLCKIVRTRANFNPKTKNIQFIELVSGHETYQCPEWFADWTTKDDWIPDDPQSGRPVDIAVPIDDYEALTGRRPLALRNPDRGRGQFGSPIAAIRVGDRWHEVYDQNTMGRIDLLTIDDFIPRA